MRWTPCNRLSPPLRPSEQPIAAAAAQTRTAAARCVDLARAVATWTAAGQLIGRSAGHGSPRSPRKVHRIPQASARTCGPAGRAASLADVAEVGAGRQRRTAVRGGGHVRLTGAPRTTTNRGRRQRRALPGTWPVDRELDERQATVAQAATRFRRVEGCPKPPFRPETGRLPEARRQRSAAGVRRRRRRRRSTERSAAESGRSSERALLGAGSAGCSIEVPTQQPPAPSGVTPVTSL